MSLAVDLAGIGMPPEQASRLGYSALTTIVAVGTTQGAGAVIPNFTNNVVLTTAGGATAVVLPSSAELNMPYLISIPAGATTGLIFPPTLGTINGGTATTGSVNLAAGQTRLFIRLSSTFWASFITA